MSHESSTVEGPTRSQSSDVNATATSSNNDRPPTQDQRVTALPPTSQSTMTGPGDSPLLPKIHENLLNDGIDDQVSRRKHRHPILIAALLVLGVFTLNLSAVVATLSSGFYQASKPENIAKFAAAELRGKIDKVSLGTTDKSSTSSESEKVPNSSSKETKSSTMKSTDEHDTTKENEPIKIEAKIYGEIRDSMVPLVALVSILAVAIVVILGTMLKAAFAPHPNNSTDLKEKEETSPVPLLEALQGLIDSVKAAWK